MERPRVLGLRYPCGMIDSLRYGIPYGLAAFAILWAYAAMDSEFSHFVRWTLISLLSMGIMTFSLRRRNQAFFPFRYGFLANFNALIAATLVQGLLMIVFMEEIAGETPSEVSPLKWGLYHVFIESMGFVFFGLIANALWSLILRRS